MFAFHTVQLPQSQVKGYITNLPAAKSMLSHNSIELLSLQTAYIRCAVSTMTSSIRINANNSRHLQSAGTISCSASACVAGKNEEKHCTVLLKCKGDAQANALKSSWDLSILCNIPFCTCVCEIMYGNLSFMCENANLC